MRLPVCSGAISEGKEERYGSATDSVEFTHQCFFARLGRTVSIEHVRAQAADSIPLLVAAAMIVSI